MNVNYVVLSIFLFGLLTSTNDKTRAWSASQKLSWNDFKARPDKNSDAAALTASGISFGYSIQTSNGKIVDFSASVEAHFYPEKSWYWPSKESSAILNHEQLHFDITELYARKFRKQLEKLVVNQNLKSQLQRLHQNINRDLSQTQQLYDAQSNHSMNSVGQRQWDLIIQKGLTELGDYALE